MWQPIETAPKDGTKILVFTIRGDIELSGWYELKHDVFDEVEGGLYRKRQETYAKGWNGNHPTHWMPLPEPPPTVGRD